MDKNRVIGRDNHMPWYVPEDLAYFREKTLGHNVIMGKNTWLSLGKALDERTNIVLTSDPNLIIPGIIVLHSVNELLDYIAEEESFVIGGGQLFQQFIHLANKLYITNIDAEFEGDTYFPEINLDDWQLVFFEQLQSRSGYAISFNQYLRN